MGGALTPEHATRRAVALVARTENVWAIRSATVDATFLGAISLDKHHDPGEVEIAYFLLPEYWGRGYAGAAVEQVLAFAFTNLGLQRVLAETQSANAASIRLVERLGFRLDRKLIRFGAEQSIYVAAPGSSSATTVSKRSNIC